MRRPVSVGLAEVGARSPGGALYVVASDRVSVGEVVSLSVATAGRSLRIARSQRQLHGYIPRLLVLEAVLLGWLLRSWWLVPAVLIIDVLAVYLSALLPRLLARSGVRGRALLHESNQHGRATLTLQVRRGGFLRLGPRYLALWNLASMPKAGHGPPPPRSARPGWLVVQRAMGVARTAGLDLRFRASNATLANEFYVPLGFSFQRPTRPGKKPLMRLLVRPHDQADDGM